MLNRLIRHWVYGGTLAGVLLLALAPLLAASWPVTLRLTFLLLPIYMLHQYEEHDGDRFRRFVNAHIGHGKDVLSPAAVFVINVPGVWGVIALASYLSALQAPGYGLIAVYLVLVNALAHLGQALAMRAYNPGLATALLLFLPAGAYSLMRFQALGAGDPMFHAIGLGAALAIHALIVAWVKARA